MEQQIERRIDGAAVGFGLVLIVVAMVWQLIELRWTPATGLSFVAAVESQQGNGVLRPPEARRVRVEPDSPAARAGVYTGERIIAVDGIDAADHAALRERARRLRIGDNVSHRIISSNEQTRAVEIRASSRLETPLQIFKALVALFAAAVFLAVGAVLFFKRPGDRSVRVFCLFCAAAATVYVTGLSGGADALGAYSYGEWAVNSALNTAAFAWTIALLFHFVLLFPRDWRPFRPFFIHLFPAALAFSFLTPLLGTSGAVFGSFLAIAGALALIFVMPLATLLTIWRTHRRSGAEEKLQLRWPLFGIAVALSVAILLPMTVGVARGVAEAAPAVHAEFERGRADHRVEALSLRVPQEEAPGGSGWRERPDWTSWLETIASAFLVLIPITFAFGILKYRLLGIDRLIRNTTLYGIVSLLILGVYVGLTLLVSSGLTSLFTRVQGEHHPERTMNSEWLLAGVTLAVVFLLQPIYRHVRSITERRVFSRRFRFPHVLVRLGEASRDADSLPRLKSIYEAELSSVLGTTVTVRIGDAATKDPFLSAARVVSTQDHVVGTVGSIIIDAVPDDVEKELDEFLAEVGSRLEDGLERLQLEQQRVEIDQARRIQERLLPHPVPQPRGFAIAAAWEPAAVVGGDLFDIIELDEHRFAFCVGDVVGKGISAALLMAGLQATVRAFASINLSPADLCQRLHRLVRRNVSLGKFITFFYGEIDVRRQSLIYASAGHIPPLVVSADGSIRELYTGGGALGAFAELEFTETTTTICQGDRIVCITDAVTEASNGEEEYGEERFRELLRSARELAAAPLRDTIIRDVTGFCGGTLQDDLTVLVIEAVDLETSEFARSEGIGASLSDEVSAG